MARAEDLNVGIRDIEEARERIRGVAWRTPLVPAGRHEDGKVYLKLECLQRTGSFKVRGAWNRMSRASEAERKRGFVTVSAGNHGQAVAWSAQRLGSACTVWVPENAVAKKVDAIRALGAEIRAMPHEQIMASMTGDRFDNEPEVYIHPFGDRHVIAGQGTVGLEIVEDLPDVGTILVPVGGGGLSVGIATAAKAKRPRVAIYGVQAVGAAPLAASWQSGKPEQVAGATTIADGIKASRVFDYMWPHLRAKLDGVFTVSEDELRSAVHHLSAESHVVAEPAGASSLAAARQQAGRLQGPVVAVVSGGNIAPSLLAEILGR